MCFKLTILTLLYLFFGVSPVFASSTLINEFLAHPSTGNNEWVEFYNPDNTNLTSYWLDDDTSFTSDSGNSAKKSLSSINTNNPFYPYLEFSSFLNNGGDWVVLFSADGTVIDQYQYTSDPGTDVIIGRSPDGGSWTTLASSSKGNSNGGSLPSPTSTPTSAPTAAPSTSSTTISTSSPTTSFTISNVPTQINSDGSFRVSINLISTNENTDYYLSGAFKKVDGTRYFGLTKISSNWIPYSSSEYQNQYKITTDNTGSWTGTLEVKPDTSDTDYKESGDYIFKVGKYTSAGSQTWSNDVEIKINDVNNLSSDDPTSTPKPSKSPSPSSLSLKSNKLALVAGISKIATPSATSTPSASMTVTDQKQNNPFVLIGIIFIIAGIGSLGHLIFRNKYGSIYHIFRK